MTTGNASIGDTVSAEKMARLEAAVNGGKAPKKARPAIEQVEQAGNGVDLSEVLDAIKTGNAELKQVLGGHETRLKTMEEKVTALEAPKPSFFEAMKALRDAKDDPSKAQRKELGHTVDQMQTEHLPWGVRHVEKARRSTVGKTIENIAIVAVVATAAALGGKAGYNKIRG